MNATNASTQERRHSLENRIPPPLVVVLIGAAMAVIAWFTPALEIGSNVRFAVGGIAIALGALVAVQGARMFWRNKTTINPVDLETASALVTSGVFRFSRNPMYVGFTAMLVGWAVCLAAPWALVGPVAFVLFTNRFQIIPEERVMRDKFGQAYDDYRFGDGYEAVAPWWMNSVIFGKVVGGMLKNVPEGSGTKKTRHGYRRPKSGSHGMIHG
jgi:protein-S-isoprenylcysteine O-methyltransferase Ste14